MDIHAISLVKNEEDIIEYNLLKASEWASKIYVLDNASTDRTWEIVNDLKSDQIIPFKVIEQRYQEWFRGIVYNEFKKNCAPDDWWCYKLDADEFYIDNPKEFLNRVPKNIHVVFSESIEYYLTVEDVEEYTFTGNFEKDKDFIRYYYPTTWSELCFFRFRKRLTWPTGQDFPRHIGIPFEKKIRLQHFKYRSPVQIIKRLETRIPNKKLGYWKHEKESFHEVLMKRDQLILDKMNGQFQYSGCRNNHNILPAWKKYLMYLLHGIQILP